MSSASYGTGECGGRGLRASQPCRNPDSLQYGERQISGRHKEATFGDACRSDPFPFRSQLRSREPPLERRCKGPGNALNLLRSFVREFQTEVPDAGPAPQFEMPARL